MSNILVLRLPYGRIELASHCECSPPGTTCGGMGVHRTAVWARCFVSGISSCWARCSERSMQKVMREVDDLGGPPPWMQCDILEADATRLRDMIKTAWHEGYAAGVADGAACGNPPDPRLVRRCATWEESGAKAALETD